MAESAVWFAVTVPSESCETDRSQRMLAGTTATLAALNGPGAITSFLLFATLPAVTGPDITTPRRRAQVAVRAHPPGGAGDPLPHLPWRATRPDGMEQAALAPAAG
jgi:hypothetical protein